MEKKAGKRGKHIPQRTCIACRETLPKRSLIRIVRTEAGVKVDPTGKLAGRGAYLHDKRSCWEKAIKGSLAHALKTEISPSDHTVLLSFIETFPPENSDVTPQDESGAKQKI